LLAVEDKSWFDDTLSWTIWWTVRHTRHSLETFPPHSVAMFQALEQADGGKKN